MTESEHRYAAFLIGSPDIELSFKGGAITLDAGRAPHVEGTIRVPAPDAATLEALDPRAGARIRIEVDADTAAGAQARTFDLCLRRPTLSLSASSADVPLRLASDEALLGDYAPLADDVTPWQHQGSLRALVDYVLGTVVPGAALETTPADDADLTATWDVMNVLINPNVAATIANWTSVNTSAFSRAASAGADGTVGYARATASAASFQVWPEATNTYANGPQITAERWHTFSAYVRTAAGVPTASPRIIWWDAAGGSLGIAVGALTPTTGAFQRISVAAVAPVGAVRASAFVQFNGASGNVVDVDCVVLCEGRFVPDYVDGAVPDTALYQYDWTTGVANASNSTRTALTDTPEPEAFVWKAGQNALDFLMPLVQVAGYRLVCDEQRQWTLRDEDYTAEGSFTIRYGVNLIDGESSIDLDAGDWFDAAVTTYTWTEDGRQRTALDAYALNTPHTRLRTFEKTTPYPGPGFSEYAVRRAQQRGREVTATVVADWAVTAELPGTIKLAGIDTQYGTAQSVTFDFDRDEVTINTRTTELIDHAWLLQPAAAWTTGPVGESWTEAP